MERLSKDELAGLRGEIDRIDDALVELLEARLKVVRRIGAMKRRAGPEGPAIRPAREAAILRRLVGRPGGGFPRASLVRMWRELLAATTSAQAPLRICVAGEATIWDLARDHFGSLTPLRRRPDAADALRLVAAGEAQLAVIGLSAGESWWLELARPGLAGLRVIARLPFGAAPGRRPGPVALVIGALELEPSGDDVTLVVVEDVARVGGDRLLERLGGTTLTATGADGAGEVASLAEVPGFIDVTGARLQSCAFAREADRCKIVGAYARPLDAAELA